MTPNIRNLDTATQNDAQGDLTHNSETVTNTSKSNETVTNNSNGKFEKKLLSNWTIPVIVPTMNLRIDQSIVSIVLDPQTLLTPATQEVVAVGWRVA